MKHIISFDNLVVSPYKVEQLLDVQVEQKVNEHSTFCFKALLPEGKKDNYVKRCVYGSNVNLMVKEDGKIKCTLFQGMVKEVAVRAIEGSYYMEVQAVSYSYLLDIEKRSRTFQKKQMSYDELTKQVASRYGDAVVADLASNGAATGQFLVQYEETDWEFLKRLASHFHTGVVSDIQLDNIRCYFGFPTHKKMKLESYNYSVKQDIGKYLILSQNGICDIVEQDFISYQIESKMPATVGDKVQFKGQTLYVSHVKACMENGVFIYHLTLTTRKGMSELYRENERISGASLSATVVAVQNDQVKVSIKIDEDAGHFPGEPCYFPYSTIYSSQDGSGWYCMPEIGDKVRIYFPDGIEEHSYAISSVHEEVGCPVGQGNNHQIQNSRINNTQGGGNYSGMRDDPSVKSLRNQDGKEIRLTPDGIYIISDETVITLTDEDGVSVVSDKNIEFKSDKSIIISAQEDVNIIGLTGVDLSCSQTASIKMKEDIQVIGQEVKAN